MSAKNEITNLVQALGRGASNAAQRLTPFVYEELHRLAVNYMQGERSGHTLQPTALVNEAYLRLVDINRMEVQDRTHFLALGAQTMRRILVEHARARRAKKRGSGEQPVTLNSNFGQNLRGPPIDVLDLEDALQQLAERSQRQARVVELRFFGGLSEEEIAAVLGISKWTVRDDWKVARAWLTRLLRESERG